MHSGHTEFSHSNEGTRYSKLNTGMENFISYLTEDCMPQLQAAGLNSCAEKLQRHLDRFDAKCSIPYATDSMEPAELKQTYDHSAAAIARMCGLLYKNVNKRCSFAEHHDLLQSLMDASQEFNQMAQRPLHTLGLDYHEFDSLALELESKLGVNAPMQDTGYAAKEDRRRRLPKDPDKIEAALHQCIDTAVQLRDLITNDEKKGKLDRIVGDVRSILSNLPDGDDEVSKGRRISSLVSASAKVLKVSKWIRKVDLLETEQSISTKQAVLRNFDTLTSMSRGMENGKH
jgi:hypothetical protein